MIGWVLRDMQVIIQSGVVGIGEQPLDNTDVFPNPTTDKWRVSVPVDGTTLVLQDVTGRIAWTACAKAGGTDIDASALPAGIYFLSLSTPGGQAARLKVVKE